MMTRKDYVATAQIFDDLLGEIEYDSFEAVADAIEKFADYFQADNPRFSRDVFYRACGLAIIEDDKIVVG